MNKHCSRPALPIPHCCIPRSFQLRGKCSEIWIYFPYFSSRFGFSFFFVSFLWKKHLSPCKVTLLISLCASSHCCLLMYPKDSQSTRDCDVSGMSLSVLLPPPLPSCNLIYSCDAFFAVWHACSVLICDIIWGSIRVRKKGDALSLWQSVSNCLRCCKQGAMQLFNCTPLCCRFTLSSVRQLQKLRKLYLIKEIAFESGW